MPIRYYDDDRERLVPLIGWDRRHILDLGCGRGESLIAANPPAGAEAWGVDINASSLEAAEAACPGYHFCLLKPGWTRLPFPDGQFDCVISRGGLCLMNIPVTLRELSRVMQPRALLWISIHEYRVLFRHLRRSIRGGHWKDILFRVFVGLNGVVFHLFAANVCLPKGICESFQTKRGMRIALQRAGFVDVVMEKDELHHFVVTAKRDAQR